MLNRNLLLVDIYQPDFENGFSQNRSFIRKNFIFHLFFFSRGVTLPSVVPAVTGHSVQNVDVNIEEKSENFREQMKQRGTSFVNSRFAGGTGRTPGRSPRGVPRF